MVQRRIAGGFDSGKRRLVKYRQATMYITSARWAMFDDHRSLIALGSEKQSPKDHLPWRRSKNSITRIQGGVRPSGLTAKWQYVFMSLIAFASETHGERY